MNRKKEDIVRDLNSVAAAMSNPRLALWRLVELKKKKRKLQNELVMINRY